MITEQRIAATSHLPSVGLLADKANHLVQVVASPSLFQLLMRVALAVPFWRSGILKWSGFLKLSDTATTLFSDEFMLHLPGGPYHYPAPTVMADMWLYVVYRPEPWAIHTWYPPPLLFQPANVTVPAAAAAIGPLGWL